MAIILDIEQYSKCAEPFAAGATALTGRGLSSNVGPPMSLVLKNAKRFGSYIELNPENMRFSIANGERDDLAFSGFGCVERAFGTVPRLYAVYAVEGKVWFQAGRRRWDITNGVSECRWWSFGWLLFSGFSVSFLDGTRHRVWLFHPFRAVIAMLDPTYDGMDADSDHFLLFVRAQIVKPQWREYIASLVPGGPNNSLQARRP